jgi:hypothetical protein
MSKTNMDKFQGEIQLDEETQARWDAITGEEVGCKSMLAIGKYKNIVSCPLYKCPTCEGIYQVKVTECDCTVGEEPKWIQGTAFFPS